MGEDQFLSCLVQYTAENIIFSTFSDVQVAAAVNYSVTELGVSESSCVVGFRQSVNTRRYLVVV